MVQLPTADTMRRRLPQEGLAVVDVADGSAIAKGTSALGAGLQQAGTVTLRADLQNRAEDNQLTTAAATVELSKGLLDAKDIPKTDGDFTTWQSRYDAAAQDTLNKSAALIPDSKARQQFMLNGRLQIDAGRNAIGDATRTQLKSTRLAVLSSTLDDSAKLAVDPRAGPEDHNSLIAHATNALDDAVKKGDLTPLEAEEQKSRFLSSYAYNRRLAYNQADPTGKATPRIGYAPPSAATGPVAPQVKQVLLGHLASDKDPAIAIDRMKPRFATNLASMFDSAPPDIKAGLGILSGARSRERQQQLWNASDKSGKMVGSPDGSHHVLGDAVDLSWNGKKLDDKSVPQAVRDWVRTNAPRHGLGLPMDYEPWHVEDFEARPPDSRFGAKVRQAVAGARPDLMAGSSINRAVEFPAVSPQQFFGPGIDVASLPAGLRNNNPGNIKYVKGSALPGIVGPSQNTDQGDPQAVFSSPQAGATASAQLLLRKFDGGKGTVRQIIAANGGWTPGNNAAAQNVAKYAGLDPDAPLDLRKNPKQLASLMRGIFMQEQGDQHAKYDEGLLASAADAAIGGEPVRFANRGASGVSYHPSGRRDVASARVEPIVFDTDQFLTPGQRLQLDAMEDRKEREYQSTLRVGINRAVENAPAAIENGGQYSEAMPNRDDFHEAFGAEEGEQRFQKFTTAVDTASTAYGFQTQSNDEIQRQLRAASPANSTGDNAAIDQQRFDVLQKAAASTLKARQADPAGYVMQAMPQVKAAWQDAQPGTDQFANALRMTADAQTSLGIAAQDQKLLPVSMATDVADTFKDESRPQNDRVSTLTNAVFATKDPQQQQAIFQQLVKAGVPPLAEGALEAWARGDQGASKRLMYAALVDPTKLPGSSAEDNRAIKDEVQKQIMAPGQIGDAIYGLSLGQSENAVRASRDDDLLNRAIKIRISGGESVADAVESASKDLYGDKQVFKAQWGLNAVIPVDKGTDTTLLRAGLEALKPNVRDTVGALAKKALDNAQSGLTGSMKATASSAASQHIANVVNEGVWRPNGDGIGFMDSYTGAFVPGPDGKPLTFTTDQILQAGRKAAPPPPPSMFAPSLDEVMSGQRG